MVLVIRAGQVVTTGSLLPSSCGLRMAGALPGSVQPAGRALLSPLSEAFFVRNFSS